MDLSRKLGEILVEAVEASDDLSSPSSPRRNTRKTAIFEAGSRKSHFQVSPPSSPNNKTRPSRKCIVEMSTSSRVNARHCAAGWHAKTQRRHRREEEEGSAKGIEYNHWLAEEEDQEPTVTTTTFKSIGQAPFDIPMFPARLTPVRFMSPSPPPLDTREIVSWEKLLPTSAVSGSVAAGDKLSPSGAGSASIAGGEDTRSVHHPPRSFSRQCKHVMLEQGSVKAFDVISIYQGCRFFSGCSLGFLRELLLAGGPPAWRGVSVPPYVDVYQEGDPGHSLFVIARGKVGIVDKQGTVLKEFGISECIGEVQVLGINSKRLETVRALTSCQLLVTTESTLMQLLKRAKEDGGQEEEQQNQAASRAASKEMQPKSTRPIGRQSTIKALQTTAHQVSLFHDERRHFEAESVRIYKEFTGSTIQVSRNKKRGTLKNPQTALDLSGNLLQVCKSDSKTDSSARYSDRASSIGDDNEASVSRDRLLDKVISSLRGDMRRGFMMPADAVEGGKHRSRHKKPAKTSAIGPVISVNGAELDTMAVDAFANNEDDEDEAFIQDNASPLDPHCLPPMSLLSPVQKHGILRQLKHINRAKAVAFSKSPGGLRRASREIAAETWQQLSRQPDKTVLESWSSQQGSKGSTSGASMLSVDSMTTATGGGELSEASFHGEISLQLSKRGKRKDLHV